jgi:hypothetical protein
VVNIMSRQAPVGLRDGALTHSSASSHSQSETFQRRKGTKVQHLANGVFVLAPLGPRQYRATIR